MVRVCVQLRVVSRAEWIGQVQRWQSQRGVKGVRWVCDICRTINLTGAFIIWRNDARMRGKTGELLHHFDASGVWDDLSLTLAVRSKLPLSDDPRLILCLTFSNSSHRKKLDFKCSLSRWTYWGGNLCPESALSCCCCRIFFLPHFSGEAFLPNCDRKQQRFWHHSLLFHSKTLQAWQKKHGEYIWKLLFLYVCVSVMFATFLHKRVRYDLHSCK